MSGLHTSGRPVPLVLWHCLKVPGLHWPPAWGTSQNPPVSPTARQIFVPPSGPTSGPRRLGTSHRLRKAGAGEWAEAWRYRQVHNGTRSLLVPDRGQGSRVSSKPACRTLLIYILTVFRTDRHVISESSADFLAAASCTNTTQILITGPEKTASGQRGLHNQIATMWKWKWKWKAVPVDQVGNCLSLFDNSKEHSG